MNKSDSIQGILFNKKPVLLQERATKRATLRVTSSGQPAFFHKLSAIKPDVQRISRRKNTLLETATAKYARFASPKRSPKKINIV